MKRFFTHYLTAHPKNGYTPRILAETGAIMVLAIVIAAFGLALRLPTFLATNSNLGAVLPAVLVRLANESRSTAQVSTFKVNPLLEKAAQAKANDMATKGYFSHFGPDGTAPWYWMTKAGYEYRSAGENLAMHFVDSTDVHKAWLASPSHRANIMNPRLAEIGIAVATGTYRGYQTVFVVQMFGTPLKPQAPLITPNTDLLPGAVYSAISNPKSTVGISYLLLTACITIAILSVHMDSRRPTFKKQKHIGYGIILIITMMFLTWVLQAYFSNVLVV